MEQVRIEPTAVPRWLALGVIAVLMGMVFRVAWVTDDAYITLRQIDNWVNGYGLRWNVGERVQAYTHPLWMLLLSVFYVVTREAFVTSMAVGILTTLAASLLLMRVARTPMHAVAALGVLMLSRSFVEYSTSGLENPLTHLLIGAFVWVYAVRNDGARTVCVAVALLALNRTDAALAVAPALLHVLVDGCRREGWKRTLTDVAIGFSPLLAWLAFQLFYYGFLVPNTAFAKLNTGLPRAEVMRQGFAYLINVASWDPPTVVTIGLGVGTAFAGKQLRPALLAVGTLLYLLYIVHIGGDFMVGRFLTLPLFMAACLIATCSLPLEQPMTFALFVLPEVALFLHPSATESNPAGGVVFHSGVADEHAYYRENARLMLYTRGRTLPGHPWAAQGQIDRSKNERVTVQQSVGFYGYFAGPSVHVVDLNALAEPLLARLPARYNPNWRVGHYLRVLPPGYVETRKAGRGCLMQDEDLCTYYEKLALIVSGDLFSLERLKTIVAMNLGGYDHLIDRERYKHPQIAQTALSEVSVPVAEGSVFDGPGTKLLSSDGSHIVLGQVSHAERLSLSLDGNDRYEVSFFLGEELRGSVTVLSLNAGMMHTRTLDVPRKASSEGFDRILVRPLSGDGKYSVAFVRLSS